MIGMKMKMNDATKKVALIDTKIVVTFHENRAIHKDKNRGYATKIVEYSTKIV